MTADQIQPENRSFNLFVGAPLSGKSTAAASYPKPLKIFDIDKLTRRLKGFQPLASQLKDIEYQEYDKSTIRKLEIDLNHLAGMVTVPYKTVVLSSISSLQLLLMKYSIEKTGGAIKDAGKKLGNFATPTFDDWGFEASSIMDTIVLLKALPCNVIVEAHWIDEFDAAGNVVGKTVDMRKKNWNQVSKFFDEIYFFERKMGKKAIKGQIIEEPLHFVTFRGELANTIYQQLQNKEEITGKLFYDFLVEKLNG